MFNRALFSFTWLRMLVLCAARRSKCLLQPNGHADQADQQLVPRCILVYSENTVPDRMVMDSRHSTAPFRYVDLIVFVGFSFRDDDVVHVLLKALSERQRDLRLLIVDSTYTKYNVASRLEEAARRSTFPTYVPENDSIAALKLRYGIETEFDTVI